MFIKEGGAFSVNPRPKSDVKAEVWPGVEARPTEAVRSLAINETPGLNLKVAACVLLLKIYGMYLCSRGGSAFANQLCSGRGRCDCECSCEDRTFGQACECDTFSVQCKANPMDTQVCSGK